MIEDIRKLVMSVPFKAFNIHLPSGQVLAVTDSHLIALSPLGDRVNVFTADGHFHLLDVSQVVDLEIA